MGHLNSYLAGHADALGEDFEDAPADKDLDQMEFLRGKVDGLTEWVNALHELIKEACHSISHLNKHILENRRGE